MTTQPQKTTARTQVKPKPQKPARATPISYDASRLVIVPRQRNPYRRNEDEHSFFEKCLAECSCKMSRLRELAEEDGYEFDSDKDFFDSVIVPLRSGRLFLLAEDLDKAAIAKLDNRSKKLLGIK